jgi:hypothetical protein
MKPLKTQIKFRRNLKFFSYPKKYNTTEQKISLKTKSSLTSRDLTLKSISIKESPTLCFPLPNPPKLNSFFLTPRNINIPISLKNRTMYYNSFNRKNTVKKKTIKSKLNRPVINLKNAKIIKDKLKHLNIIDFGSTLKLYDDNEKKMKKKVILQKIDRQLEEIYYDYDKNNQKVIINSFSGNSADLLRNKVSFVTGIMNYLYPKIVLNKMEFLKKMKHIELKEEKTQLEYNLRGKIYNLKYKNPRQNAEISKYFYMDDVENLKYGKYLTRPKVMVNNNVICKLKYDYEFM